MFVLNAVNENILNKDSFKIFKKIYEIILNKVINSLKELKLLDNFIIKIHPQEKETVYKEILQKLGINPIVVKNYNILKLIKSANLLISRLSTTIMEGMIMGTPVIALDLVNLDFCFTGNYLFMNERFLINVKDQSSLTEKLRLLINDHDFYTKYSEGLRNLSSLYYFYDDNEKPVEKVSKLILKILSENN